MYDLNHYAVLGARPTASDDEIKSLFRLAARRFHPDVNRAPGAVALFKTINASYETLADPARRSLFDRQLDSRAKGQDALRLEVFISRRQLRRFDGPQIVYALVKIVPLMETTAASDAPLNLALVIDRSKSMQGRRMDRVKAAARRLVELCDAEDILSVIAFSDHAEVVVPAQHVDEIPFIQGQINTIRPDGSTAMYNGLQMAMGQIERHRDSRFVNHIVMITDGRTYGDEDQCFQLARRAYERGIGISGMGIGEDWNDLFLDELASITGGTSTYVSSEDTVTQFLQRRIRSLATAYAERAQVIIAPVAGITVDEVMRISPDPIKLDPSTQPLPLGTIDGNQVSSILVQFRINTGAMDLGEVYLGRIDVSSDVLGAGRRAEWVFRDLQVDLISGDPQDPPPPEIVDALSRVNLFRLQDRARTAIEQGDIQEATRQLELLSTRLLEAGQKDLAEAARLEALRVSETRQISDEGAKNLRYGTRALITRDVEDAND